ncbi:ribosome-associated protein [Oceanospirillum multiglobuliferum]|uniref:Dual-action ribosomal maturation protein DarP n=1 Tax=Oceanospirillum multiglobuliferum TaxID=64969 RepID=A0A1T4KUQ9_9GAMM|nr:ribosome biogenesis factor YjgA [Oceanospirillum multiglobuliferum]OPX54953.1 hypothetical protein BTE48_11465 [Oceanospirillum multiglobuliferum]SJZ46126.1 ribosome-associated protein [Oceanospirillum multiglobuliferum]
MTEDTFDEYEAPSKSQIKREMHALQVLGKKLLELNADQLKQIVLTDDMLAAIAESRRIRAHEAQRRHLQYIGKLMRHEDIEAISAKLALFDSSSDEYNKQFHQLEHWRDRLVAQGDDALNLLMNEKPEADRQSFRQLIRQAQKEQSQGKPPAAARKIFRELRTLYGL